MSQEKLQTIDLDSLAECSGGNSYVRACYRGAITGGTAGIPGGPKTILAGSILGCLGVMAENAYERNS
jgi:hypothetical protein